MNNYLEGAPEFLASLDNDQQKALFDVLLGFGGLRIETQSFEKKYGLSEEQLKELVNWFISDHMSEKDYSQMYRYLFSVPLIHVFLPYVRSNDLMSICKAYPDFEPKIHQYGFDSVFYNEKYKLFIRFNTFCKEISAIYPAGIFHDRNGRKAKVFSTFGAYALLANGRVLTWGAQSAGGRPESRIQKVLSQGIVQVASTFSAFCAVTATGSCYSWGDSHFGGNSQIVQQDLKDVIHIVSSNGTFCALTKHGQVIVWGKRASGGDTQRVKAYLTEGVIDIVSTRAAFAALKSDGSVVTWGYNCNQGRIEGVLSQLKSGIVKILSNEGAFSAIHVKDNKAKIHTWGLDEYIDEITIQTRQWISTLKKLPSAPLPPDNLL